MIKGITGTLKGAVGNGQYDRFINLKFKYRQEKEYTDTIGPGAIYKTVTKEQGEYAFSIDTTQEGAKPRIDLEYQRVPGNFCYQCNITVYNLYMQVPAADIDDIEIEMGYTMMKGDALKLTCHVFAAYQPNPGPDAPTHFECLVGSASDDLFETRPYSFEMYIDGAENAKNNNVEYVIDRCLAKLGAHSLGASMLTDELKKHTFTNTQMNKYVYGSGMALIDRLQFLINAIAKAEYNHTVTTIIFDKEVYFVEYDEKGNIAVPLSQIKEKKYAVVDLNICSNAVWNAGVLNITAPYNPKVRPGSIIKIKPSMYQGSYALPNVVARQQLQKDPDDMYYVITQGVQFSTWDSNEMKLLCIPFKSSPILSSDTMLNSLDKKGNLQTVEDYKKQLRDTTAKAIVIGKPSTQDETVQNIQDLTINLTGTAYTIKSGDTLSDIANALNIPTLKGHIGNMHLHADPPYIPGFCLIMIATNTTFKQTKNSKFAINLSKPDDIKTGNLLTIPQIDWKALQSSNKSQLVNVFKVCREYYQDKGDTSWADNLERAANLIDKGVLE